MPGRSEATVYRDIPENGSSEPAAAFVDPLVAEAMTPWGKAGTLRERRLRPGPGVPRRDVERNQRERIFGATVAVTATLGYGGTRVSDLIETAGVSRATFYKFFANKEECFLAALDGVIAAAIETTAEPLEDARSWEQSARLGIDAFAALIVAQPAGARMCLVESYAAGPAAIAKVDAALAGFRKLMAFVFEQLPGHQGMPPELVSALTGGLRKIVHTRLHRHTEAGLVDLLPELLELGLSYQPPPEPLRWNGRRAAPDAGFTVRGDDYGDRIERAALAAVAARGYEGTAISDIATEAGVSLSTFYDHFDSKALALEAALRSARMRLMAAAEPAFRRARSWPEATRTGIEAGLAFFEAEPDFARVTTLDVYGAGAEALERLDISIEVMRRFIDGGFELNPDVEPVAREAIPSAMYAMLCERIRSQGTDGVREMAPIATYLALAPFLGPEEACEVANSSASGRRRAKAC